MPLDQWLKNGRKVSVPQVLRLGREIAEGLAAAHERGLIHRDIKPGNIWLDSSHKGRVKILDFGLARSAQEDVHLTQTGAIMGTPAYMAPEQARSEKVDARSDLFSLGCVLYRLCTGAMPFAGDNTMSLLMALALDHPKPVRDLNPDVPPELADLVTKLLAKDPAQRPQTAREVVHALQAVGRTQAAAASTSAVSAVMQPVRPQPRAKSAPGGRKRRPWIVAAVAAGFLATAVAATVVVIIRDKDGNKIAEVTVPPGGKLEVVDDGKKGDAAVAPKSPPDDAWLKKVAALPAEKQVQAVMAKLKELNPGFDGEETHVVVKGGVVTELQFLTDKVTDISPVRTLTGLQTFTCAGGPGRISDLSPLKDIKLTFLNCSNTRVTDLSPLQGMPLTELRCNSTKVSDLSPLKGMPLTYLECQYTPVSDLSPLKGMPLTVLHCDTTRVGDLSSLKGMPLTILFCENMQVSDLSPLKGMPLTELHCGNSRMCDLSPLEDMKLTVLNCSNTQVTDLSPLKGMPLWQLNFENTPVSDLSPLKGIPLMNLGCHSTKVSDLSPLKGMPLKDLNCDFKPERDADILRSIPTLETINGKPAAEFWKDVGVAPKPSVEDAWFKQVAALPAEKQVEAVAAKLKELNPGFDGKVTPTLEFGVVTGLDFVVDNVTDISPVRALNELRELRCAGSGWRTGRLADLSPLKGMKLTTLVCEGKPVSDLSPLKGMPLTSLDCRGTKVSDLSPLVGVPLNFLDFYGAPVSDLWPLKGIKLTGLNCGCSPVSDLSPLRGMPLSGLFFDETNVSDLSPLKDMKLTVLDCYDTKVSDLSPLKGMPLTILACNVTKVFDLSPLKGMPLKDLNCDFVPKRDADILRSIKTLEKINDKPAAEFWKHVK
jgi:Leucine-rich repeat (LRR) protein